MLLQELEQRGLTRMSGLDSQKLGFQLTYGGISGECIGKGRVKAFFVQEIVCPKLGDNIIRDASLEHMQLRCLDMVRVDTLRMFRAF
jgi:hypothetical protein